MKKTLKFIEKHLPIIVISLGILTIIICNICNIEEMQKLKTENRELKAIIKYERAINDTLTITLARQSKAYIALDKAFNSVIEENKELKKLNN